MSWHAGGRPSSCEPPSSEEEWDAGTPRCRLTAVEELRGHLNDCLSLYSFRFLSTDVSSTCIRKWNTTTSTPMLRELRDNVADERTSSHPCDEGDDADGFDVSTAAVVLFLRDGARAATPGAPLGIVVLFQYCRGFTHYAERHYSSVAEAEADAAALAEGAWSLEEEGLVHGARGWTLLTSETQDTMHSTDHSRDGSCQDEVGDVCEGPTAYESLMSLLVHRYL
jgi:hypothetical protein